MPNFAPLTHTAFVGIGSNLDQPLNRVKLAIEALGTMPNTRCEAVSPLYQTKPVGPPQPDFINAVVQLKTSLAPLSLLDELQEIEHQHARVRRQHWGPRTLDLDILLYDDDVIDLKRLQVPHPYLMERSFVIVPLHDITPDLVLPNGVTLASLRAACDASDLILLVNEI